MWIQNIDLSTLVSFDVFLFFGLLAVFLLSKYLLSHDIEQKSLKKGKQTDAKKNTRKDLIFVLFILFISFLYIVSHLFEFSIVQNILQFCASIFSLYIITLILHRQILLIYGEEVETAGQSYFKRGYKVSLFSIFVNIFAFFIAVFLCIKIFEFDSFIEIWGLWAGILAFMWFTAPVWALDMIAGIILLQSKNFESGDVFFIYESKLFVWIKSISLTEVKCIDLSTGNPIIFRPSKFRDLTFKNVSHGITWKTSKIMQKMEIYVDYDVDPQKLKTLCEEAFDLMHADAMLEDKGMTNYFWEEPYRELVVENFDNYAVHYTFFYTITSGFYVFKAQRLLNQYLYEKQREYQVYFSTPDLIKLEKTGE